MAKVRLADIAAQIGVSTVTVHNALTGQKGVSNELRARHTESSGRDGVPAGLRGQKTGAEPDAEKHWRSDPREIPGGVYDISTGKCIRSWLWWPRTKIAWPLWRS